MGEEGPRPVRLVEDEEEAGNVEDDQKGQDQKASVRGDVNGNEEADEEADEEMDQSHRNLSSRTKGVWWNKRKNKWMAQGRAHGKQVHIGYYHNKEDAAHACQDYVEHGTLPARKTKGVSWDKSKNKWMAQGRAHGKQIHIGYYDNKEDAARASQDYVEHGTLPALKRRLSLTWHPCVHGTEKKFCGEGCGGSELCKHGRLKARCKVEGCGRSLFCKHGKSKYYCIEGCGGSAICLHGKHKAQCTKGCGGSAWCIHGKRKAHCTEGCGGSQWCVHGNRKARCSEGHCGCRTCKHGKLKMMCIEGCRNKTDTHWNCTHGKQKARCTEGCFMIY